MIKPSLTRCAFACTFVTALVAAGCKTTGSNDSSAIKADSTHSNQDDIPVLSLEKLTPAMITRLVAVARKDAVAIFGGRALFHMLMFDNSVESGPCAGAFGVRIVFANPDEQTREQRPYAMYTIDPSPASPTACTNSISAGPKWATDVASSVNGTENMEKSLGGFGGVNTSYGIKISISEAVKKLKTVNPKFEVLLGASVMNPADPVMKVSPWALIYGQSCGEGGIAYVNLATGKVLEAARPMKTDCP